MKDYEQIDWSAAVEDDCRQLVRLAVREDLDRFHDWTTVALVPQEAQASAVIAARSAGIIAGLRACEVVIREMNARIDWQPRVADGDLTPAGATVAELRGSARDLLVCERLFLNILGRLSGIATLTRTFVETISGTGAAIYDTRKTTPGWRRLEKYAVRCGGGRNHRTGLFDGILIKDNHLAACAAATGRPYSPAEAVRQARIFLDSHMSEERRKTMLIEIEVDTLEQFAEVLSERPDVVLLDNMSPAQLREAVVKRNSLAPDVQLEASGGVSLQTVSQIAATGVDRISVGALTHSAAALDLGLDWREI